MPFFGSWHLGSLAKRLRESFETMSCTQREEKLGYISKEEMVLSEGAGRVVRVTVEWAGEEGIEGA